MILDPRPAVGAPLLVVSRLVKVYGAGRWGRRPEPVRAVDDLSFEIRKVETFGLVGESGSGKSTTSRMIMRLERPTAGTITFGGRDVWRAGRAHLRELRRDLQIVYQNPVASLNRRHSVAEIVAAPLEVASTMGAAERRRRVHELIELVGLDPIFQGRRPGALSGGQRQRVAIARALALDPRLIVLDEAVSALDVSVRAQILNLLRDLQGLTGVAYLFISHDLSIVRYMAPRLAVMQQGRIVEEGPRDAIFDNPRHAYTRSLMAAIPQPDPRVPFPLRDRFGA